MKCPLFLTISFFLILSLPDAIKSHYRELCIFPSGRWAKPEDEDEYAVGPFTYRNWVETSLWVKYLGLPFFHTKYEAWTVVPDDTHQGQRPNYISSCLYNLKGTNVPNPWEKLPRYDTGVWGPLKKTWKKYFSEVSSECHFTSCDSNLYVTFTEFNGDVIKETNIIDCMGFYTIDFIPKYPFGQSMYCGRPSYRHLTNNCYIRMYREPNKSCLDSKKMMIMMHKGSDILEWESLGVNFTSFDDTFVIDKAILRLPIDRVVEYGEKNIPRENEYKKYVCLKDIVQFNGGRRPWIKSNREPVKSDIISSSTVPFVRGPCGASYRQSENFPLDTGSRPWVVFLDINQGLGKCTGSILTVRHVITVASCICDSHSEAYNVWRGGDRINCLEKSDEPRSPNRRMTTGGSVPLQDIIIQFPTHTQSGAEIAPKIMQVLWVSLHPRYNPKNREFNVAIIGTLNTIQFSSFIYPICLYNPTDADSTVMRKGRLIYGQKALEKNFLNKFKYTNANGNVKYGKCKKSSCNYSGKLPPPNDDDSNNYPEQCRNICSTLRRIGETLEFKQLFHRGYIERGAEFGVQCFTSEKEYIYQTCGALIKISNSSRHNFPYREGFCYTIPSRFERENEETDTNRLWGYCDDSNKIYPGVSDRHPLYEVETTIVRNHECGIANDSSSLICTGYLPRKPSKYELEYKNGRFKLLRYLGGYYRDPIKKIIQRQRRQKFDQFGNPKLDPTDNEPHVGFPIELGICHMDPRDVGSPSHIRLHQNQEYDTVGTQEPPEAGSSIAVLVSMQSGRFLNDGKICNLEEGYYYDEEVGVTNFEIYSFIKDEISKLDHFDELVSTEELFVRVLDQRTTTSSITTKGTTSTAGKTPATPYNPWNSTIIINIPYNTVDFFDTQYFDGVNPLNNYNIYEDIPFKNFGSICAKFTQSLVLFFYSLSTLILN